jgi:hypothetical protein
LEKEVVIQADKAKKIADLNNELRDLITQERDAYNEEKLRLEEEVEQAKLSTESKVKLQKNKLLMVL